MPLHHLPVRSLGAAANMAVDTLLLEAYPQPQVARFRHYGWSSPAFTFGRTQQWQAAREHLPIHTSWQDAHQRFADAFSLVRRPTGGGVVDHRNDWTYALVIPADHPFAHAPARSVYRDCHLVLIAALAEQGITAQLAPCPQESACKAEGSCRTGHQPWGDNNAEAAIPYAVADAEQAAAAPKGAQADMPLVVGQGAPASLLPPTQGQSAVLVPEGNATAASVCFVRAEPYDIITEDGEKLAGAAQKRNRHGLLIQGSVNRILVAGIDWQRFECDVARGFGQWLAVADRLPEKKADCSRTAMNREEKGAAPAVSPRSAATYLVCESPFPKWPPPMLQGQIEHYASEAWNRRR